MKLWLGLVILFAVSPTEGALPPARMILERTAENAGSGSYQIEQEIQFPNGFEPLFLKETWMVESDRSMKLVVTGPKDLQPPLRFEILYAGGQKWTVKNGSRTGSKVPEDFFEKAFHSRTPENLIGFLAQQRILNESSLTKKPLPRKSDEIVHEPEAFLRLSRTGGSVTWAIGKAADADGSEMPPGLWIEQDQFLIRKIRLLSSAEISADEYSAFARGLHFPKTRVVRWGDHSLTLKTLQVSSKKFQSSAFQPSSLEAARMDGLGELPARILIEEFYSRFR